MFHILGVALYCRWMLVPSSWQVQETRSALPGILTPIFRSIFGVHVRIMQQLLPVPFRSVPFRSWAFRVFHGSIPPERTGYISSIIFTTLHFVQLHLYSDFTLNVSQRYFRSHLIFTKVFDPWLLELKVHPWNSALTCMRSMRTSTYSRRVKRNSVFPKNIHRAQPFNCVTLEFSLSGHWLVGWPEQKQIGTFIRWVQKY